MTSEPPLYGVGQPREAPLLDTVLQWLTAPTTARQHSRRASSSWITSCGTRTPCWPSTPTPTASYGPAASPGPSPVPLVLKGEC